MKKALMVTTFGDVGRSGYPGIPNWAVSFIGDPNDMESQRDLTRLLASPLLFTPMEIRRKTLALYGGRIIGREPAK